MCPDFPEDYVLVDGTICERDECADIDQGGCSHNCTNTIGGYMCYCPGELSLVTDGLTCGKMWFLNFYNLNLNNNEQKTICLYQKK